MESEASNFQCKETYKNVTHVIFDLDGLLIESENIYKNIINEIAQPYGKQLTKDIRFKILGTTEGDTAHIAIKEMDLPITQSKFLLSLRKKTEEKLHNPNLMPGARELIKHLHKHNIPIAVATSSSTEAYEKKTKNFKDIFSLFSHVVCGSSDPDVKNGKPAPDIFLVCASRFIDKPNPEKCIVFEDAPNGIAGALAAGMQAILIPDPDITEDLTKNATLVLKSLNDFKPKQFGLPEIENLENYKNTKMII